ncbi:MAG: VCBS repeat-containing protein [Candidatus Hydrogenedens sp.]|jgi:hypothetical protein|nr:VCBS repeat-containing protein [Candidatus Hydrogenedens sp.]
MPVSFLYRLISLSLIMSTAIAAQGSARLFSVHPRSFQVGSHPCAIALADLNGDGIPDIVTADRGELHDSREERPANDELSVLLSDTPFNYIRRHPSLKTGFAPYALALANVDSLKWPDIISVNFHTGRNKIVSVFLNFKDEGIFKPVEFKAPDNIAPYERHHDGAGEPLYTTPGLTSLVVADFNHDGLRDLAATGWSNDTIMIMTGHADDVFNDPVFFPLAGAPRAICCAHLDEDDHYDLIVALYATSEIALLQGNGKGDFIEKNRFNSRGKLPVTVNYKDVNGDGKGDIIVGHAEAGDNLVIFYGDRPYNFSVAQDIPLGKTRDILEYGIKDAVAADFNDNGAVDIAVACHALPGVVVLVNESDSTAIPQKFRQEEYSFKEGIPLSLAAADLDGSGYPDLAVSMGTSNTVGFLKNNKQ